MPFKSIFNKVKDLIFLLLGNTELMEGWTQRGKWQILSQFQAIKGITDDMDNYTNQYRQAGSHKLALSFISCFIWVFNN